MSAEKNYERERNGGRLDFGGINTVYPPDVLPPNKFPYAQNVRRYLKGAVTGRATQDSAILSFGSSVSRFTDNFNRADGAIGANYYNPDPVIFGNVVISGNKALGDPAASTQHTTAFYVNDAPHNVYVQVQWVSGPSTQSVDLFFRADSAVPTDAYFYASFNCMNTYWYVMDNLDEQIMDSRGSGTGSNPETAIAMPSIPTTGDVFRVEAFGNTITVKFNSTVLWSGQIANEKPTGATTTVRAGFGVHKDGMVDNLEIGEISAPGVHSIRRLNDSTPAGPVNDYVLIAGVGTGLYAGAIQVDSSMSGKPISLIPFRPNASVQPWMYAADANRMRKVRSDGTCYKDGIAEPQAAPSISVTAASASLSFVGQITAYIWGDSPHSGATGVYIWKNPNDGGGSGPSRNIADAKSSITGNSLLFDVSVPGNNTTAVAWTEFASDGTILGTKSLFQPAMESQGYSDFNVAFIGTFYVPAAGNYVISGTFKDDILFGIDGAGVTFTGSGTKSTMGQSKTAVKGYPLMPRTAEDSGEAGHTGSLSVTVYFPKAGNYPFELDWDYWYHSGRTLQIKCGGVDIKPIPDSVVLNAQYRYTYRSSATGAKSNPSPPSDVNTVAVTSSTITPNASVDPQVDKIDFYRLSANLTQWTYVGTGPNSATAFKDALLDTDIANNPPLEFDNHEPFPSIDLPHKGVVNVSGGLVSRVSGDFFDTRWLPGTVIVIGSVAYTLDKRPVTTEMLTAVLDTVSTEPGTNYVIQSPVPDGTGLTWEIAEPYLAAQPLPYMWGPTDNVMFMFACGDATNPGKLYWTKGNNPDSAPDTNQQDVTSPSEPLQNGCIVNGIGMVFSTERAWLIYPNFFNALATVTGTQGSTWTLQESISTRGLYIPRCLAVDGGGNVFFRAKDGVYISPAGIGAKSITDADLYNLFPHEGMIPEAVTRGSYTVYPPDDSKPDAQQMSCANGYLYYDYQDLNGIRRTLVFDIEAMGWVVDAYQYPVNVHVLQEGPGVNGVLTGCADGTIRPLTNTGAETAVSALLMPCYNAGEARAQKRFGDVFIECE